MAGECRVSASRAYGSGVGVEAWGFGFRVLSFGLQGSWLSAQGLVVRI